MQVMAEHGNEIDNAAVASMPYAEAAAKEAMRLTPIVSGVSRVALKTFEVGGYTIPKVSLYEIWLIRWPFDQWRLGDVVVAGHAFCARVSKVRLMS